MARPACEVHRSLDGGDADAWDDLVARAALPSPFLRSWWLGAVAPGARYHLVRDGERLLGGVALEAGRRLGLRELRLAGDGPLAPDHLDLLAEPGHGAAVAAALRPVLVGAPLVELAGLVADPWLAGALRPGARRDVVSVAPYARLGAWDDYLAARPGRLRNAIARGRRRLERGGVVHRVCPRDDVEAAIRALRALHGDRWESATRFLGSFDAFARAARAGAARGEMVFHELRRGEEPIAVLANFVLGDREHFYQSGRRTEREWRGAGTVLHSYAIEQACAAGRSEYDLLRGDEPYKQEWATDVRPVVRIRADARLGRFARRVAAALGRLHRRRPED